jgi:hypothetical protein
MTQLLHSPMVSNVTVTTGIAQIPGDGPQKWHDSFDYGSRKKEPSQA